MQKMPLRGSLHRAVKVHEILGGYPRHEPFETREEVEKYLSTDEVQCLLCGRSFKNLGIHLRRIHQIDADDYRLKYNMPRYYGLVGRSTRTRMSENSSEPTRVAFISELGRVIGGARNGGQRKCALVRAETSERMKKNSFACKIGGIRRKGG